MVSLLVNCLISRGDACCKLWCNSFNEPPLVFYWSTSHLFQSFRDCHANKFFIPYSCWLNNEHLYCIWCVGKDTFCIYLLHINIQPTSSQHFYHLCTGLWADLLLEKCDLLYIANKPTVKCTTPTAYSFHVWINKKIWMKMINELYTGIYLFKPSWSWLWVNFRLHVLRPDYSQKHSSDHEWRAIVSVFENVSNVWKAHCYTRCVQPLCWCNTALQSFVPTLT